MYNVFSRLVIDMSKYYCMLHQDLTGEIINAFYEVYNVLGYGFLEKVYEKSMMIELQKRGFECRQQEKIGVYYDNTKVGDYFADIIVSDLVIIELKAAESLNQAHVNQLINYLRATNIEVGLILNFGKNPEFKRKIFTNNKK